MGKIWLKNSLSHLEEGDGDEAGLSRETGCGRQGPQVEARVSVRVKRCCVKATKGSHWMVEIKLLCLRWLC